MSPEGNFSVKKSRKKDWIIKSAASVSLMALTVAESTKNDFVSEIFNPHEYMFFVDDVPNISPEVVLAEPNNIDSSSENIDMLYKKQTDFELELSESLRIQEEEMARQKKEANQGVLAQSISAFSEDVEMIVDKIYLLESTRGLYDSCKNHGRFNGYGYGQNSSSWMCFDTFEEATATVSAWVVNKINQGYTLAELVCLYNTGSRQPTCGYYQKFLNAK